MRRYRTLTFVAITILPTTLFAQEWALEADVELVSHYEWRGLQLDPGVNSQHSVYGSLAWSDLILTAGVWSLTDLSSKAAVGLPERWAFETSPWIEASLGGNRGYLVGGLTRYTFRSPAPGTVLRRGNTWEVYAGARGAMPGPLAGRSDRLLGRRPGRRSLWGNRRHAADSGVGGTGRTHRVDVSGGPERIRPRSGTPC